MGKHNNKRQQLSKREEEKGQRTFRNICIGLLALAILMIAVYAVAL